jgi:hypothetical protein
MTFRWYALPNRYRRSSLCPLTLLIACAAIAVAYRYEWVIPEYNGTWDNALYTDLKASDRGLHDLLTSSLTEEQFVLRPSFFSTFCSQQWPVADGVEWYGGWWTMNLNRCGLIGCGISAVSLSDWGKARRTSVRAQTEFFQPSARNNGL